MTYEAGYLLAFKHKHTWHIQIRWSHKKCSLSQWGVWSLEIIRGHVPSCMWKSETARSISDSVHNCPTGHNANGKFKGATNFGGKKLKNLHSLIIHARKISGRSVDRVAQRSSAHNLPTSHNAKKNSNGCQIFAEEIRKSVGAILAESHPSWCRKYLADRSITYLFLPMAPCTRVKMRYKWSRWETPLHHVLHVEFSQYYPHAHSTFVQLHYLSILIITDFPKILFRNLSRQLQCIF